MNVGRDLRREERWEKSEATFVHRPDGRAEFEAMWINGVSRARMAAKFGVSEVTVYRRVKRYGLVPRVGFRVPRPAAKVDAETVRLLRSKYVPGCRTHGVNALARRTKLVPSTVWRIVNRKTWRDVV